MSNTDPKSVTFVAEAEYCDDDVCTFSHLTISREGMCRRECLSSSPIQAEVVALLDPASDEEIIVTFTKRKRA